MRKKRKTGDAKAEVLLKLEQARGILECMMHRLLIGHHNRSTMVRCLVAFIIVLPATIASAQRCVPTTTSNEADLFGIRSLSLAMSRGTAIAIEPAGTIRLGAEAVFLPTIDAATARPTTCRPGKEGENVNALKAAGRVRATAALPRNIVVEANWLPPVAVKGVRGNVLGLAVGGARRLTDRWVGALRANATFGTVKGAVTCPQSALVNEASECFGGTLSDDTFEPNMFGGDISLGFNAPTSRFAWFGGTGYSRLMPRFQVSFRNQAGILDTTRVLVDLNRITMFAGVTASIGHRIRGSGEFYATTRDGVTGRIIVDALLRGGN